MSTSPDSVSSGSRAAADRQALSKGWVPGVLGAGLRLVQASWGRTGAILALALVVGTAALTPNASADQGLSRQGALGLAALAMGAQPGADAVKVVATPERAKLFAGDQGVIAVTLKMEAGYHIWPNKPVLPEALKELSPIATKLEVANPAPVGVTVYAASAQWPKPHAVPVRFTEKPVELLSLTDGDVIFVPIQIAADAKPGKVEIPLTVSFQACNETMCLRPSSEQLSVSIEIIPIGAASAGAAEGNANAGLFAAFDRSVFGRLNAGGGSSQAGSPAGGGSAAGGSDGGNAFDFFGYQFTLKSSAIILLLSFIAGALMNFTPCVLPVIPLKINSLQHQASQPGKMFLFGTVFCVGILAVFGVIAFAAVSLKLAFGQWFSSWYITVPLALIVGLMGLSMMGLFTFKLPSGVYALSPTHDTVMGNFLMGVLTAVLSTPCTGPMFGAAFAYAVKQDATTATLFILMMGAGMAAPYALLIAFPSLIRKMPRGGPGGELLKRVLGVFMLAVAVYIGSNIVEGKWPFWIVGGVACAAAVYWIIGAIQMLRTPKGKMINVGFASIALICFVPATLSLVREGPIQWQTLVSPADATLRKTIDDAVASGKTVVVDFTAKWCATCIVIEQNVLNTEEGVRIFNQHKPVRLRIDLTNANDNQGWGTVKQISGGGGIPLIAIYGPKAKDPIYFQSFFGTADLERAIKTVGGF